MEIRIAGRVVDSIVDGPGLRYALFVQGCPRSCPGCHNPQTHDPNAGIATTIEEIFQEIVSDPLLDGVTFSGGEPFMQARPLVELARWIKERKLNLVVYTGYSWEELIQKNDPDWNALLELTDALVDGPFIVELRDWKLKYAGSSNQRIIDVRRSLKENVVVQLEGLQHIPE